jgi:hypothetical protein
MAQPQSLGCAPDATLREQYVECDKQVEIGCGHALTIAQLGYDADSDKLIFGTA